MDTIRLHCDQVLDHRPLQQGLRLFTLALSANFLNCTRPSSTTTRIKTHSLRMKKDGYQVLDHRPLQQGLRHHPSRFTIILTDVLDHRPLQQGLRPD